MTPLTVPCVYADEILALAERGVGEPGLDELSLAVRIEALTLVTLT
jgi:hypothetical protein